MIMINIDETRPVIKFLINNKEKYNIDIIDDSKIHNVIFFYFENPLTFRGEECTIYEAEGAIYNIEVQNLELFKDKDWEITIGEFHDAYDVTKIFDLKKFTKIYQR